MPCDNCKPHERCSGKKGDRATCDFCGTGWVCDGREGYTIDPSKRGIFIEAPRKAQPTIVHFSSSD